MTSELIDDRDGITTRLNELFAGRSNASIARELDLKPETVRRYRTQGKISIRLLQRLARRRRISPLWVLLGEGPKHVEPPLAEAATDVLMIEIGRRLDHGQGTSAYTGQRAS